MIVKEGKIYSVKSEDGSKTLGSGYTKEEAEKRLREIEYFKYAALKKIKNPE